MADKLIVAPDDVIAAWATDATQTVDAITAHGAIYPLAQGWRLVVPPSVKPPDFAPGRYQLVSGVLTRVADTADAISAARSARKSAVSDLRRSRELGGTSIAGQPVPSDTAFRLRLRELAADIADGATSATLQRADGSWATLTPAQFAVLAAAVRTFVRSCIAAERTHHDAIDALTTVEAIDAYDLSTGWPA